MAGVNFIGGYSNLPINTKKGPNKVWDGKSKINNAGHTKYGLIGEKNACYMALDRTWIFLQKKLR